MSSLTRTGGHIEDAIQRYAWNQDVGTALTLTLAQVEICLRNQVGRVFANAYGLAWQRVVRLRNAHSELQHEPEKAERRVKKAVPLVLAGTV